MLASRGITAGLTAWGKSIIIALMFIGRVGPLVMGMAFFRNLEGTEPDLPEEDLAI